MHEIHELKGMLSEAETSYQVMAEKYLLERERCDAVTSSLARMRVEYIALQKRFNEQQAQNLSVFDEKSGKFQWNL
jgi:hypothetical protein